MKLNMDDDVCIHSNRLEESQDSPNEAHVTPEEAKAQRFKELLRISHYF